MNQWQVPDLSASLFVPFTTQVFWDLENCLLNNWRKWPYPKNFHASALDAQQHYALLVSSLGSQCGVLMKDFKLHVGISIDSLIRMPPNIRHSVQKLHSQYVTMIHPAGEWWH